MSRKNPYFTVITPTYNRARYIVTAIESVLAQTFQEFEMIVVDDGSEDETASLVAPILESDSRFRYIKQVNKGRSVARNVGIEAAAGEYVCFLDSDDFWFPEHLQNLFAVTNQNTTPAFYYGDLIWWFEEDDRKQDVQYRSRDLFQSNVEFVVDNQFAPNCVCVHHYILEKHKFHPGLFLNEDLELWARIAVENPVLKAEGCTATLRVHPGNTMSSESDTVTPRKKALNILLNNREVRPQLSLPFIKNRKRSLDELMIRQLDMKKQRWSFIWASIKFLFSYPRQPRNSAKLVLIFYSLPGGSILRRFIQDSNASDR